MVAAPDEGNARPREQRHVAPDVEHGRRIANLLELRGKLGLARHQHLRAQRRELRQDARAVLHASLLDRRRRRPADAVEREELRLGRRERRLRAAERRDDEAQALRADSRNERQGECG